MGKMGKRLVEGGRRREGGEMGEGRRGWGWGGGGGCGVSREEEEGGGGGAKG